MGRLIGVQNHKGGVAKSTTAVNLAAALALQRKRVLLVDYDGQADASKYLGLVRERAATGAYTSADLTLQTRPFDPVRDVQVEGLDVVLSMGPEGMRTLEGLLCRDPFGSHRLARALAAEQGRYDFVLVDCAPNLGVLAENVLSACDEVLVPIGMQPGMMSGALDVLRRVGRGVATNPSLHILGVVPTLFDARTRLAEESLALARGIFAQRVTQALIHQAVDVARSAASGTPVVLGCPRSRSAREYLSLTEEVLNHGC